MDETQKLALKVQALLQEAGTKEAENRNRIADLMVEAHTSNTRVQELQNELDRIRENEVAENEDPSVAE